MTPRPLVAALALLLAGGAAAQQAAPDLRAPLSATTRFLKADGTEAAPIRAGQAFQVQIALRSDTGGLPRGIAPMAWLRPMAPGDLPCTETAAAYRATGRAAAGSVDLNGLMLGVLNRDGALTVLDPDRALGTANLVSAHRFSGSRVTMAADAAEGRFLVADAQAGTVTAVPPLGDPAVLARGLGAPDAIRPAPDGGAWLIERDSGDLLRIGSAGIALRLPLGARDLAVAGRSVAVLAGDRMVMLDGRGRILHSLPAADARAVALRAGQGGDAPVWLAGGALHVLWPDADGWTVRIPVDPAHDRLAVDPEGRFVLAFGGGGTVSVIDLARSRVVQAVGSGQPVAEIAFIPDTAFLRTGDGSVIGILDLRLVAPGKQAVVGQRVIGPPQQAEEGTALLVPLLPEPALLAVHAGSYTGFVFDAGHATSAMPPMEALRLRGGVPRLVRALDGGLRQQAPGLFVATARLPQAVPYELVVSAGVGQASFCAPVPVDAAAPPATARPGRLLPVRDDGAPLRLRLVDGAGRPVANRSGRLVLQSLAGNWRGAGDFSTGPDGLFAAPFPAVPVPMAVSVLLDGQSFEPLVMEPAP